ncbi:head decoration protein [Methyloferula stellata]|uniref:head decoration protein n=1 Tax=Methyloferula stellata TaxID=876270 RepID=UPI00036DCD16|nr:head decoration protein [Methyloferula stellata]
MNALTETLHIGSFLISQEGQFLSRDAVAVDASAPLAAGTVLGKKSVPTDVFEPLNLSATDGTQIACAILLAPLTADEVVVGATLQKTVIARFAEVRFSDLTWPAGITAAQIEEAQNQLREVEIVCR